MSRVAHSRFVRRAIAASTLSLNLRRSTGRAATGRADASRADAATWFAAEDGRFGDARRVETADGLVDGLADGRAESRASAFRADSARGGRADSARGGGWTRGRAPGDCLDPGAVDGRKASGGAVCGRARGARKRCSDPVDCSGGGETEGTSLKRIA
ncbi:hypothetical protein M885DRAFT_570650 [Pelagophyceae sp. CCMP2097]|nr:hypothetical protein M885DRAFT_570650 [Pelagophyceae sp. CCMP2097]